ncbi:DUF317 domain-containing protein [Streptomyces sp. NPDC052036]|uniref:DUF317 domain-containing protein n=1 Tax=Streptomyces sp. NPDC052036 TaxID=3155171 RepID=UPI00342CDB3F
MHHPTWTVTASLYTPAALLADLADNLAHKTCTCQTNSAPREAPRVTRHHATGYADGNGWPHERPNPLMFPIDCRSADGSRCVPAPVEDHGHTPLAGGIMRHAPG